MRFSIWADWVASEPVTDELLLRVNRSWRSDDETFCSGPKRDESNVLSLSFDMEAADFDAAARSARAAVERLASDVGIAGYLRPLTAYTETHQFTES